MAVDHAWQGEQATAVDAPGARRVEAGPDLFDRAAGHADIRLAPVRQTHIRKQGRLFIHGAASPFPLSSTQRRPGHPPEGLLSSGISRGKGRQ